MTPCEPPGTTGPMTTATVEGLTDVRARELAREGKANAPVSGSGRTTARILRTTVFSFYNNTLFVIGFALLALGRYSDALVSVGLGIINAALAAFQELRAKRQLDRLQLLAREPVTVVRDGADRSVPPSEVVVGDLVRLRSGGQIVVDGPLVGRPSGGRRVPADRRVRPDRQGRRRPAALRAAPAPAARDCSAPRASASTATPVG